MTLIAIFFSAFFIGFSGAMMPGPMLGITIDSSLKKGFKAGPLLVLGHGTLELILVFVLAFGLKDFFSKANVAGFIGVIGGFYLAFTGYSMIQSSVKKQISLKNQGITSIRSKNLILAGVAVSISNPYFIMWWATTGIEFVRQSYQLGIAGLLLFFFGHVLADLTWYTTVSATFSKGRSIISDLIYRRMIILLGLFILGFSIYFIKSGIELFI